MNHQPLVSVVIPAYNCAEHIAEALDSALAQDYANKEIIVIDDGSTDDTVQVLETYADQIRLIKQENSGSAVARNRGIEESRGELIAFLDSDDLWLPGKLSLQVAYLAAHPETGLVYNNWLEWNVDESGQYTLPTIPPIPENQFEIIESKSGWIYNQLINDCIVHTTAALVRREILEQSGYFDPSLRKGQDYDLWFRISRLTRIDKLAATLSLYRINLKSITFNPRSTNYGYLIMKNAIDKWGEQGPDGTVTDKNLINERLYSLCYGFAYTHYVKGDPWLAAKSFFKSLQYKPFKYRTWGIAGLSLTKAIFRSGKS